MNLSALLGTVGRTDTRHKTETHGDHNQFTVKPVTRRGCRADTNGRIMIISLDRNQIWHCRNRRNEFRRSKLTVRRKNLFYYQHM